VLLIFSTLKSEDFITEFEYGQMLYQDPRGASCVHCHGETGAGEMIAEYTDKKGDYVLLNGPDIRHASLEQIRQSVHHGTGVMPRYFLTEKEIRTIHAYLQRVNKRKATGISSLFSKKPENNLSLPSSRSGKD
jgi:mono/diheme cytochrome c family protein